ncbi:MAG: DMT family transporter [Candidatus Dojkabacteria bacterium]|jgi:drug/metabolite transporter (DMT)-like permease|nr:DMT family transporter [Candidatus Dojkabacteria bacterium]
MKENKKLPADIGLLSVVIFWGSSFIVTKESLHTVNAVALVAYRFLISALPLGMYLVFSRRALLQNFRKGFLLGAVLFMFYIPQTLGLNYTSASNSGFITGMLVVFVPIFSFIFFRRNPGWISLLTVSLAIAGLWILTGGISEFNLGDSLTLITACAGALHILVADKYIKKSSDPYILHFQQLLVVGVLSVFTGIIFGLDFGIGSQYALNSIIYLAITSGLYGYGVQLLAQKYVSPVTVSLIFTLEPVFAGLFAWTLGGEEFVLIKGIGGGIIVLATVLQVAAEGRKKV